MASSASLLTATAVLFTLLFIPSIGRRYPRSYDAASYCSACRAVARELSELLDSVSSTEVIPAGSFRLDAAGKQRDLKHVPYRGSDAHVNSIIDNVCQVMTREKYVYRDGVFRRGVEEGKENGGKENYSKEERVVRGLGAVCHKVIEEGEELIERVLKDAAKGTPGDVYEFVTGEVCGNDGINACADDKTEL